MTDFRKARHHYSFPDHGERIEETFIIPKEGDYKGEIHLSGVPKVSEMGENGWENTTIAQTCVSILLEQKRCSLSQTYPPNSGFAYLDIQRHPGSNIVKFSKDDYGKTVTVNYSLLYPVVDPLLFVELQSAIHRLEAWFPCSPFSMSVWSQGRFDESCEDSSSFWIAPSGFSFEFTTGIATFPGILIDLGIGEHQVTSFESAHFWKRIIVAAQYDNAWKIRTIESAEKKRRGELETPSIHTDEVVLISCDVKNNGDIDAPGQIVTIIQEHLRPYLLLWQSLACDDRPQIVADFVSVNLKEGFFVPPYYVDRSGIFESFSLCTSDTGKEGQFVIDILLNGASIFYEPVVMFGDTKTLGFVGRRFKIKSYQESDILSCLILSNTAKIKDIRVTIKGI